MLATPLFTLAEYSLPLTAVLTLPVASSGRVTLITSSSPIEISDDETFMSPSLSVASILITLLASFSP